MKTHTRNPQECHSLPLLKDSSEYGSGRIVLFEKTFCSGGNCEDLKVCSAAKDGESAFYLPVNGEHSNMSKLKVQQL